MENVSSVAILDAGAQYGKVNSFQIMDILHISISWLDFLKKKFRTRIHR